MCNELIHVHACCIPFCKPSTNVCNQIQYCLGKVAQILTQKQQSYTRNHTTLCLRVCMFQFSCRFAFLSAFHLSNWTLKIKQISTLYQANAPTSTWKFFLYHTALRTTVRGLDETSRTATQFLGPDCY